MPASQNNIPDSSDVETPVESTSPWDVIIKRELTVKSSREAPPRTSFDYPKTSSTSSSLIKPSAIRQNRTQLRQLTGSNLAFGSTPNLTVLGKQRPKSLASSTSSGSKYSQNKEEQVYEQHGASSANWDLESSSGSSFSHLQDMILQKPARKKAALRSRSHYEISDREDDDRRKEERSTALNADELLLHELLALECERYDYEYGSQANLQDQYHQEGLGSRNHIPPPLYPLDRVQENSGSLKPRRLGPLYNLKQATQMPIPVSPVGTMESDYLPLPPMLLPETIEQNQNQVNNKRVVPRHDQTNTASLDRSLKFYASDTKRKFANRFSGSSTRTTSLGSATERKNSPYPVIPDRNRGKHRNSERWMYYNDQLVPTTRNNHNSERSLSKRLLGILSKLSIHSTKPPAAIPMFNRRASDADVSVSRKPHTSTYIREAVARAKQKLDIMSRDERKRVKLKGKIVLVGLQETPNGNSGAWI